MNSKKMIITTISLLLTALLIVGTVNVLLDPLFLYHKPWFGLEANVINGRYQNAGIAKNFDFENVIIGNSFSENFVVSDVEDIFDGKTVKLTASGSLMLDWTYVLNILSKRDNPPKSILLNFDLFFLTSSPEKLKHELPTYLYDDYYLNDIEYLFNFALTNNYTYRTLSANLNDTVPDYNTVFMWSEEYELGKNVVLEHYFSEQEEVKKETNNQNTFYTEDNLALLEKYVDSMPDTQFVFHYSPYSILYWKNIYEMDLLDEYKAEIEKVFRFTSQYDNIKMYFWSDDEMFDIIGDLDNYRDAAHFGAHISKKILQRIDVGMGLLSKEEAVWKMDLDCYFEYLENYDYAKIFE